MSAPSETPPKAGHLWPLDGLRGLAALTVCLGHFGAIFYPASISGGSFQAHSPLESWFWRSPLILLTNGTLAVCIFFVLSGYVLTFRDVAAVDDHSRSRALLNMVKRPIRLGGMVVCMLFLSYGLKLTGGYQLQDASLLTGSEKYVHNAFTFTTWLRGFLQDVAFSPFSIKDRLTVYDPPLWTIRDELWGSWLVFGVLFITRKSSLRMWLCVVLLPLFSGSYIQGMLLGMMLARVSYADWFGRILGVRWVSAVLLMLAFPLCCYPYYVSKTSPEDFATSFYGSWPSLNFLAGGWCMVGGGIVVALLVRWGKCVPAALGGFCRWLGKISYSLYAVHFIVMGSLSSRVYLWSRQHEATHHSAVGVAFLITMPVLAVISWLLWRFVDVPSVEISRRVSSWVAARLKLGDKIGSAAA